MVFLVLDLTDELRWINELLGVDHLFLVQNEKTRSTGDPQNNNPSVPGTSDKKIEIKRPR